MKERKLMTMAEQNTRENQGVDLLITVGIHLSLKVAHSVQDRYGDPHNIGSWELEEMIDDLISKLNDGE